MSKTPQVSPALHVVVAVAANGIIGRAQGLPWRQRNDLRHFKELTLGHPVLMGRRTWESIGRALPGRLNLVLSREPGCTLPGAVVVDSVAAALAAAGSAPVVMVIGGATLYRQTLPTAEVMHLTEIHAAPAGDAYFPDWDRGAWLETGRLDFPADADNDYAYSFLTLTRRRAD